MHSLPSKDGFSRLKAVLCANGRIAVSTAQSTFTGFGLGQTRRDRIIVGAVCAAADDAATVVTVSSATVGGASATVNVNTSSTGGSGGGGASIFSLRRTFHESDDIVINWNGSFAGAANLWVYAIYGAQSLTPFSTGANKGSGGATSISTSLALPLYGVLIATAGKFAIEANTWNIGMSVQDGTIEDSIAYRPTNPTTSQTVTMSFASSNSARNIAAATYR